MDTNTRPHPVPRPRSRRAALGATLAVASALGAALVAPAAHASTAIDASRGAGIYELSLTRGATVFDYDGDGWDDVLVNHHYSSFPTLYENRRDGTFADVTDLAFPPEARGIRDPHLCDAADVDLDGRQDVFCTTGGRKGGTGPNPDRLWIQQPDGTFRQLAHEYGVEDPYGRGRMATFLDANGDPYPDLLVGNTYPRKDGYSSPNRLFVNREGTRFVDTPSYHLDREVGANSLQAIDFDGDGREDVFMCGKDGLRLYRNVGYDHFRNVTHAMRARMDCDYGMLADLNGDRRPDLLRVNRTGLRVHLNRDGSFRRPAWHVNRGGGRAVAAGDVNGDGRQDVYFLRSGPYDDDSRDLMLVNHRGGHDLERMRIPQTKRGIGEAVTPIDYDRNGLTDFIVENGHRKARGPIRLIAFR